MVSVASNTTSAYTSATASEKNASGVYVYVKGDTADVNAGSDATPAKYMYVSLLNDATNHTEKNVGISYYKVTVDVLQNGKTRVFKKVATSTTKTGSKLVDGVEGDSATVTVSYVEIPVTSLSQGSYVVKIHAYAQTAQAHYTYPLTVEVRNKSVSTKVKDAAGTVTVEHDKGAVSGKAYISWTQMATTDNISYQWQVSADGSTWADVADNATATATAPVISGATTATLTGTEYGKYYRVNIAGTDTNDDTTLSIGSDTKTVATGATGVRDILTVANATGAAILKMDASATPARVANTMTIAWDNITDSTTTITGSPTITPTYQWQRRATSATTPGTATATGNWEDVTDTASGVTPVVSGATTDTLEGTEQGYLYRVIVTGGTGDATIQTLSTDGLLEPILVSGATGSVTITNKTATIKWTKAPTNDNLEYQWQVATTDGTASDTSWNDINSTDNASAVTATLTGTEFGKWYRVKVNGKTGTDDETDVSIGTAAAAGVKDDKTASTKTFKFISLTLKTETATMVGPITEATSATTSVVTAALSADTVTLTSVQAGTSVITVKDSTSGTALSDTFTVTVAADGSMSVTAYGGTYFSEVKLE